MAWTMIMKGIGMGASASGSWLAGEARENEAKGQAAMMRYNASVEEQNAVAVEQKSRFDQITHRRAAERAMGALRARLGASGALVDEGAGLYAQADQAFESELQNSLIGYEGQTAARKHRSKAATLETGAQYADLKAKYARTGKTFGTIASLFGGASSMMS